MPKGVIAYIVVGLLLVSGAAFYFSQRSGNLTAIKNPITQDDEGGMKQEIHPLSIEALKKGEFPGSDLSFEQKLDPGSNYQRYIVSYKSDGLKIYALLTVPNGTAPAQGWPVIIFNHGFIPPLEYRTTERYIAYTDAFSRNGYVLLRPDYRGHGNSEGQASGGYGSNGYTIDVLNALSSIKRPGTEDVIRQEIGTTGKIINNDKIGMWGHSMGGFITLRNMVVSKDIKAGVIWGGVVASYEDLFTKWRRPTNPNASPNTRGGSWRQTLTAEHGTPEQNPEFWKALSANSYLADISGPLQLQHGTADTSVPLEFSQILENQMKAVNKPVELFAYQGDDHDISNNLGIALQRSVEFFDRYLK